MLQNSTDGQISECVVRRFLISEPDAFDDRREVHHTLNPGNRTGDPGDPTYLCD